MAQAAGKSFIFPHLHVDFLSPDKINRGDEEPPGVRSGHCAAILQVVNSKRSWLPRSRQDTVGAKTNRHSDEVKGGAGGLEDIEEAADDLLQVPISSPCLFSSACPFSGSPPLLFTPSNGYLPCWKGLLFLTRERSTKRSQGSSEARETGEKHKQEQRTENIIGVGLPGDRDCLPHSCNGTEGLAADSERKAGEKKKNYMSIFVPAGCLDGKRYITFSWLFPPKANSRALPLFGIKRT